MSLKPILLIGGSGLIGRHTAQLLRETRPDVPLLIGGRNLARASEVAAALGNAEGVAIDLTSADLGLGDRQVSAVAVFFKDDAIAGLRFARARGVPQISISSGAAEIGPEVAAWMQKPAASAVVLGAEWLVGSATVPALAFSKNFGQLESITISALLDQQEQSGPATESDLHRLSELMPAALTRRNGDFIWLQGSQLDTRLWAIDGTETEAVAFSPFDVMGLAAATDAPGVAFKLGTGVTSSRRRGEPMSTEIIIELAGEDHHGQPLHSRYAVFHPQGQVPLTALGIAMVLERLTGLDGQPAVAPGLYFPCQMLVADAWFARLAKIGGQLLTLEAIPARQ